MSFSGKGPEAGGEFEKNKVTKIVVVLESYPLGSREIKDDGIPMAYEPVDLKFSENGAEQEQNLKKAREQAKHILKTALIPSFLPQVVKNFNPSMNIEPIWSEIDVNGCYWVDGEKFSYCFRIKEIKE